MIMSKYLLSTLNYCIDLKTNTDRLISGVEIYDDKEAQSLRAQVYITLQ